MKKEFCRYAIWDIETGVMLVSGEKYKAKDGLQYVESFSGLFTKFRKVNAFARHSVIKGRKVDIVYWFNAPKRKPCRKVNDGGLILGLR
ncbi:MAG: hypothetical protein K2I46_01150 [Clostridia bacterium]|nr:hypothetical protein [Clostridia bacterium]